MNPSTSATSPVSPDDERRDPPAPPGDGRQDPPKRRGREVIAVFLGSLVLIHTASLAQRLIPALGPYLYVIVALIFLVIPTQAVLRWRRQDPIAAGMRFGSLGRGLRWGLGATFALMIPFLLGFHLWHTHALGLSGRFDLANYLHWEDTLEGRPADLDADPEPTLHVWSRRQHLHLWWPADAAPPPLTIDARAVIPVGQSNVHIARGADHWRMTPVPGASGRASFRRVADAPGEAALGVAEEGQTVDAVLGGALARDRLPRSFGFGYAWLLAIGLTQLFFVALPEEYFYRGYIQPTLAAGDPPDARWSLGPLYITPAILLTSVLFALGHVLVEWHWHRLMVFFPSLAFGWLRERSEGLIAPLIFHACCNLMVELTAVHYT